MPINLDFVGLNTLVREEIDPDTNTIGQATTKALRSPSVAYSSTLDISLQNLSLEGYGSTGAFSFSFWYKSDDNQTTSTKRLWWANTSGQDTAAYAYWSSNKFIFIALDLSGDSKFFQFTDSVINHDTWRCYALSWSGNFAEQPVLWINGVEAENVSTDTTPSSGTARRIFGELFVFEDDLPGDSLSPSLGSLRDLAFYKTQLESSDAIRIYSNGFINDLRGITRLDGSPIIEGIVDYWRLGPEPELSSLEIDDQVPNGTIIKPTLGLNSLEAKNNIFVSEGPTPETRNKLVATVPYSEYFAALNTHRNGPYGHSTFKQLRAAENPVTRFHNKNNIFSIIGQHAEQRTVTDSQGRILSIHTDKHGPILNFEEPVVTVNKPISSIINAKYEDEFEILEQKLIVKTPYSNETTFFKNRRLNVEANTRLDTHGNYQNFKDTYMKSKGEDSVIDSVESVKLSQTIFPTELQITKTNVRQRPNFISGYWRDDRLKRAEIERTNGFGHSIPTQSVWVLDAESNFENGTLVSTPGTFKLYGPAYATASTTSTPENATGWGFNKLDPDAESILYYFTRTAGLATEFTNNGFDISQDNWVERGLSADETDIVVEPNGAHLLYGVQYSWQTVRDHFLDTSPSFPAHSDVTFDATYVTRPGIYLSDLGSLPTPSSARRNFFIQNISRDRAAPAGKSETYRQHWHSCSVDCGISFWNALYNHPIDSYNTLMFDVSASIAAVDVTYNDDAISFKNDNITALNRQIYFSTGSEALNDSGFTSYKHPRLVVRLGTKWFKNDGSVHYGNVPESGAVEYIFDKIYTDNNPFGVSDSGDFYLKPMLGRQQHFYLSLSQSHLTPAANLNPSGNVLLAINGEVLSASAVNDQWGFFNGLNHRFGVTGSGGAVGYTASMWTAACTASAPTDVFWFQAGNAFDDTYMNEMYFSDIAVFSGAFVHNDLTVVGLENKIKHLCGGVKASEALTSTAAGSIRYVDYPGPIDAGVITELSGPFLWYDFMKDHLGATFQNTSTDFGLRSAADQLYGAAYDYSGSGQSRDLSTVIDIYGYVEPITQFFRLDNRSYADFTLTPGNNLDTYAMRVSNSVGIIESFVSPGEAAVPIGGGTGFNSQFGGGLLQNSYSQFSRNLSLNAAVTIDAQMSASCFYSRRHSITSSLSVVNPFFRNLSSSTIYPVIPVHLYLGTANWDAPNQAGFFDADGSFVSSSKVPFYDSYDLFAEEFRGLGKEFSIVPEFKISDHINHYLSQGPLEPKNDIFEISGGLETLKNSSQDNFYKVYTNTDFLKHFAQVKEDHAEIFDPYKVTLECKAIKKFLPYDGFYPAQRTVQIAEQFYSSYGDNTFSTSSFGVIAEGQNFPKQYLLNPLFGPGVLFNTIRSGIACDYPILTSSMNVSTTDDINYMINDRFDARIPFEALVEPEKHLANTRLFSNEPDPNGNTQTETIWNGQGNNLYKLQMNNFLSEVGGFFLENENYTTIASLPQGDPNFGNAEGDKVYALRLKMYRTITGSKPPEVSNLGIKFGVPQDTGSMGEAFTMYSRPSAFGPPVNFSASAGFKTEQWNVFKKVGCVQFTYNTSSTLGPVHMMGPDLGYNFPYTPPYYHGEAWADIIFVPPDGTKKYSLPEIINHSSVEFCRFYESGSNHASFGTFTSGTVATNELAMQIASSMNIFSKGILRQDIEQVGNVTVDSQLENKYRWIMQSKFETPTLNFNHHSHDSITMPNIGTSSVPIGMWHQYGRIPQNTNEGIFIQVEEIPKNWTEGAYGGNTNQTGSLLNLCGFTTDPLRVGEIKDSKVIEEAVVAIPFLERDGDRVFFEIDVAQVKNILNGEPQKAGETVRNLVNQIRKYVFPPQFDFLNNRIVKPLAMYVFEFSHSLTKQDLADIWQNLPPTIGRTHETATATVSHELFSQEFLGTTPLIDSATGQMQKFTALSNLPSDIRWMVFKVKKRASSSYFDKIFERNESGADISSDEIVATALGKRQKISYNWPYDFFSLVELIKLDASIEFGNIDTEKSIELNQAFIKPHKVKPE